MNEFKIFQNLIVRIVNTQFRYLHESSCRVTIMRKIMHVFTLVRGRVVCLGEGGGRRGTAIQKPLLSLQQIKKQTFQEINYSRSNDVKL